jgi:hypothetical protein
MMTSKSKMSTGLKLERYGSRKEEAVFREVWSGKYCIMCLKKVSLKLYSKKKTSTKRSTKVFQSCITDDQ